METLNFVSAGAAQGLVRTVAAQSDVAVAGSFGAVGAMLEELRSGARCDMVILTAAQIAELVARGEADPHQWADLGCVATCVAVRAADPVPALGDAASLRTALAAADAIYFPDPATATAGIHFAKVLDGLGIATQVAGRLRTFPNGATAMRAMADATGHPIGCTQATEILATAGAKLAAPLPPGFDLDTVYTGIVSLRAGNAAGAARFLARLTGIETLATRQAAGFRGELLRPARADDSGAIRAVIDAVLREYALPSDPSGVDRDLDGLPGNYLAQGGMVDVAIGAQGRLVGCCAVHPLDRATCELRKMYLLPEARGRGLGLRLLRRALAFARGAGFERMELETASVLRAAIALYERNGFRPIARRSLASRCDRAFALELT